MSRNLLLVGLTIVLVVVAAVAAIPSLRSGRGEPGWFGRLADSMAAGVFLGAGLVHLLPDAARAYAPLGFNYPLPFTLCGATALLLALLERGGTRGRGPVGTALFGAVALSVHSFLAGAALGATGRQGAVLVLFLALIAHKGAASFSLSRLLANSGLALPMAVAIQAIFILALPAGVILGSSVARGTGDALLAMPITLALGAGTFLYFGTLHRPETDGNTHGPRAALMIVGFALMALIATVT